jgi:hypothetical protein
MDLKRIADKTRRVIDERGGTAQLKHDAQRLRSIASGTGTAKEKAKAAGEALTQKSPRASSKTPPEPQQRDSQGRAS